jgi:3-dehydroquinate dehydratase-1
MGGEKQLVCQPIVAQNKQELLEQAKEVVRLEPDIIEWRADSYLDLHEIKSAGYQLRKQANNIPLIFTLRHLQEGGARQISQDMRLEVMKEVVQAGLVDVLDIEIINEQDFIAEIKKIVDENAVKLILSYHDFKQTPAEKDIVAKLKQAEELGADIAKLAAMPKDYRDVLSLLNATYTARNDLDIPIITISMGSMGIISRIAGGFFGSDVTFAAGKVSSAPGQIRIEELRNIIRIME